MQYHGNNNIYINILKTIDAGDKPDILCHAGLSPWQLNKFLTVLRKNSLIKYEENAQIYRITESGKQYLNAYNKILECLSFKTRKKEVIIA
jgi:predicted transcriptional regulator